MPAKRLTAFAPGARRGEPAPPAKSTVDQDTLRGIGSVYDPTPEACRDAATALDRHAVRVGATAEELHQALAMLGILSGVPDALAARERRAEA